MSSVVEMALCPSISLTTFGLVRAPKSKVAAVCRRLCGLIPIPSRFLSFSEALGPPVEQRGGAHEIAAVLQVRPRREFRRTERVGDQRDHMGAQRTLAQRWIVGQGFGRSRP